MTCFFICFQTPHINNQSGFLDRLHLQLEDLTSLKLGGRLVFVLAGAGLDFIRLSGVVSRAATFQMSSEVMEMQIHSSGSPQIHTARSQRGVWSSG